MLVDSAISDDPPVEREGKIVQVLAGCLFKVELSNRNIVLAHICGKLRKSFIKLVVGDRVRMETASNETARARITCRL
jgi:translation initiation factor IF-1